MNGLVAITIAEHEAHKVSDHKYKHGCVIYSKRGVLAVGRNKQKRDTRLAAYGYKRCTLHAESSALLKLSPDASLRKAVLVVVRVGKTKLCNSRPCEHCMAMIKERGIKEVWFSTVSGSYEVLKL